MIRLHHVLVLLLLISLDKASTFRWRYKELSGKNVVDLRVYGNLVSHPASSRTGSFVNDYLRPAAMKLHRKDQAIEGQQQAKVPHTKWTPTRNGKERRVLFSLPRHYCSN